MRADTLYLNQLDQKNIMKDYKKLKKKESVKKYKNYKVIQKNKL